MKSFSRTAPRTAVVEHAVDLHALQADGFLLDGGEDVFAQVFVGAAPAPGRPPPPPVLRLAFAGLGQLEDLVVVEVLLEVFAVGEEVEELEGGLLRLLDAVLEMAVVEELLAEVVLAGAAALDLDEVGGREDGADQAEVEDVRAVVAGGHHADGDADAGLAGLVGGEEVGRAEQVVVGEVDRVLLRRPPAR
jgi:hypothetical protein